MNRTPAEINFEIGVRALGIGYDGVRTEDLDAARRAFTAATNADDDMADAWLGRAATGEITREVIWGAWQARRFLRQASQALPHDLPADYLAAAMLVPGASLTFRASTADTLALAQAIMDATDGWYQDAANTGTIPSDKSGDFNEAMVTIDGVIESNPGERLAPIVKAGLYTITERWPDVLDTLRGERFEDKILACSSLLMNARASAHLGMSAMALEKLTQLQELDKSGDHATEMYWLAALVHRSLGNETEARKVFEQLYNHYGDTKYERAANDPELRIDTVRPQQIEGRKNPWDPATTPSKEQAEAEANAGRNKKLFEEANKTLAKQIGMTAVKEQILRLRSSLEADRRRAELGIASSARTQHLIFTGPPGTGKTTIARVVSQLYAGLGVVSRPEVVEVTRGDFIGEYEGHSAQKTRSLIERAHGAILFIDEAYTLVQARSGGLDPFGKEALDELLREMENRRDHLVVIIAGYENDIERFLGANDGLRSRFTKRIRFETYTADELVQIAVSMIEDRSAMITAEAQAALRDGCAALCEESLEGRNAIDVAGNARFVRNIVEAAEEERDLRVVEGSEDCSTVTKEQWLTIEKPDIDRAMKAVRDNLQRA